jgi:hypothetical protein
MKIKCAMFRASYSEMPKYNDIDKVQTKGSRVVFGGGKRRSKTIPHIDKIHLVESSFSKFAPYIFTVSSKFQQSTELFLFEDEANELFLRLRYPNEIIATFEIDEAIIKEMHHYSWSYGWLEGQIHSLNRDMETYEFLEEKNIGDSKFHKKFPSHKKNIEKLFWISKVQESELLKKQKYFLQVDGESVLRVNSQINSTAAFITVGLSSM